MLVLVCLRSSCSHVTVDARLVRTRVEGCHAKWQGSYGSNPAIQEASWAPAPVWNGEENLVPITVRTPSDQPVVNRYNHWIIRWHNIQYYSVKSSVGIATDYGLNGPGIESRWGRDFLHTTRPAPGPTQPPVQWVQGLSRRSSDRGVVLTTHPLLAPKLRKSIAIPLLPL
jgi:hypothetical protein